MPGALGGYPAAAAADLRTETPDRDGKQCSACGVTTTAQETVDATGEHNDGNGDGLCDVCDLDLNTDEAKADKVLAGIKAPVENVTEAGTIVLDISNNTGYDADITWAISDDSTNTDSTLDVNSLNVVLGASETKLVLTVTVTVGEATATAEYIINVSAGQVVYTLQATTSGGVTYYWDGTSSSSKGGLTTDASKAGKVYIEESSGTYYAYILDGSTKKYLKIGTSNTSFTLTTTKTAISYDSANGYLYANSRYLATYGTQDMRTYQASNIKGTNLYMVLTPIG